MVVQSELREAIEAGREETVRVLARYRAVPVVDEDAPVSDLLGGRKKPSFKLEERGDGETAGETVDRQTRQDVLDLLDVVEADDLPPVVEDIQSHEAWGEKA
ncbi:MAG: hypothetical protein V5A37_01195 [Halobacteriales archaeon]